MTVTEKFNTMGARIRLNVAEGNALRIDIQEDRNGQYFDIIADRHLQVLDVDPKDKHLVLMTRLPDGAKPKFLCGFDEQGWFAAALPEPQHVRWHAGEKPTLRRGISDIASAKASLKPPEVVEREQGKKIKKRKRGKRVNDASKRQGEWFFLPENSLNVEKDLILKNEPIQMGGRRQHNCEELFRQGGESVWVNRNNPNGLSNENYMEMDPKDRAKGHFRRMVRDASVFARGRISAPDHKTLLLIGWHKVVPNTENRAVHGARVAFLD